MRISLSAFRRLMVAIDKHPELAQEFLTINTKDVNMKDERLSLRLNQKQLSKICGLNQSWYSYIETGKRKIPLYCLCLIKAMQYDVGLIQVFLGDDQ